MGGGQERFGDQLMPKKAKGKLILPVALDPFEA